MKNLHIEKYEKGESPDYILYTGTKKIGLELTTLVLNKSDKKIPLASIRDAQNKCLKKATQTAKQNGLETVEVQAQFRSDHAPIDINKAAEELVEFVEKEIPKIDATKSHHCYESGLKYFKWIIIRLGTINGHKWLPHHRFKRIHLNWVRINPINEIQSRVDEKQSKIPEYLKKCDECWLLIGVDEWTAPEAVDITKGLENHIFSGDFKRLFFLRNIERKLVELKK